MSFRMLVILSLLAGCATPSGPPPESSNTGVAVEQYKIGVDDEIQVSVWKNPDLSVRVPVRPDGMISMPLAGDVLAGGRTPEQVAAEIESVLAQYVRDPKVAVIVANLRSHE